MLSKKILIPMAAVALIGAGTYSVTKVSAASDANDPQASLVQKLADTFHVDKSKVQAVFDQNKADHQADHEKQYEDRLAKAVSGGKLTAAQKTAILTEHAKLEAELKAAMTDSKTDRHTVMRKIRTDSAAWATQNNIDEKWLIGPGHLRGGHGGPMMNDTDADDITPSPSQSPTPTPSAG